MIRQSHRAVVDRDLRSSLVRGRGSLLSHLLFATVPVSLGFAGLTYFFTRSFVGASSVGLTLFAASAFSNWSFFRDLKRREVQKKDERAVLVTEVEAESVLELEHLGSHGPAYCFIVAQGKALLLVGQWQLEKRSYPSLRFRLHQWADSRKPIRIDGLGKKVRPKLSSAVLKPDYRNSDVEIFEASADTLQDDLDAAFLGGSGSN